MTINRQLVRLFLVAILTMAGMAFAGPDRSPAAGPVLEALTCSHRSTEPNFWGVDVGLRLDLEVDQRTAILVTSDHESLWVGDQTEQKVYLEVGQRIGEVTFFAPRPYPQTDTTVTFSALFNGSSASCTILIAGVSLTPTATPKPTRTPTPGPGITATPTIPPVPVLASVDTQTGSRAGGETRLSVCLEIPVGGTVVGLISSHPDVISVPSQLTFSSGQRCYRMVRPIASVSKPVTVTFTATLGAQTLQTSTLVRPQRPWISLQTVSRADGQSRITLCLAERAGPGGLQIALTSSEPSVFPVPQTVTVTQNTACTSLVVEVGSTTAPTTVTVQAVVGSQTLTGTTLVRQMGVRSAESTQVVLPDPATPVAANRDED